MARYASASGKPIENQPSATRSPDGSPAAFATVIDRAASPVERSITGYTAAAVAAERPARNAQEPRNAARSRRRASPARSATSPASAAAPNASASGRRASDGRKSGFTRAVPAVTAAQRMADAIARTRAAARLRSPIGPSVFHARNAAPCAHSAASAKTPTSAVYQSRIPTGGRAEKSVKSGSSNQPSAVSGTPRSRLPSAAPKKTGSSALATKKKTSHEPRHTGSETWLRNSIEMPRRIRHHSTRKIAK